MRLVPRSFAGRLILLLLLALLVAQGVAFAMFAHERREAVRQVLRETVVARTAGVARLLAETPPRAHRRVVRAASSRRLRFWIGAEAVTERQPRFGPTAILAEDLAAAMGLPEHAVRVGIDVSRWHRNDDDDDDDDDHDDDHRPRWLVLSVPLAENLWLNAETGATPGTPPIGGPFLVSLVLSGFAVAGVGVLAARRLSRPMRRLAQAADGLGRGEDVPDLAEEGPDEARRTVRAFNRMHGRLDRFMRDRTAMLAAISHDLRTPITSLRLRAELVEDTEARAKIVETLYEMREMTEATLAFLREEAAADDTRPVDIAALLDSIAEDLAELGLAVDMEPAERTVLACRPAALRRALRNLIENAASHGERATLHLAADDEAVTITIDDQGPGIPEADLERVFTPFTRLDEARGQDSGGMGLGLAIARTILRAHGGEVTLANRAEGGLRAEVRLPKAA
jgi:signal transduction histidine kinase